MKTVSLRMPSALHARLTSIARRKQTSQSDVLREALEAYVRLTSEQQPGSAYDLVSDLLGSLEGPADLSTNPRHLEDYGR